MSKPLLVYCAGAYSADNVITMLGNIRRGLWMAYDVIAIGHYPYVPWSDVLLHLVGNIPIETCYAWSLAFMAKCDCVLVNRQGANQSKGTQKEISIAGQLGIRVFYDVNEVRDFALQLEACKNDS